MARKHAFDECVERLAVALMDHVEIKAVMMGKDEFGNVAISFVEGIEESHKVRFGVVERCSRLLTRCTGQSGRH